MPVIGRVESVWRYPVKSMAGEELPEIYAGFAGIWGDRLFAFKSSATPAGFPYLTGREAHQLLMYRPRFRDPQRAAKPANLAEAEELSPLLNPVAADPSDFALDIESPSGELLPIDGQTLLQQLNRLVGDGHSLTLLRSRRVSSVPVIKLRCWTDNARTGRRKCRLIRSMTVSADTMPSSRSLTICWPGSKPTHNSVGSGSTGVKMASFARGSC